MKRLTGIMASICGTLLGASSAAACSVCFAAPEDPMTRGAAFGMLVMVAITAAVLLGFGTFFITLARRERLHQQLVSKEA